MVVLSIKFPKKPSSQFRSKYILNLDRTFQPSIFQLDHVRLEKREDTESGGVSIRFLELK